MQSDIRLGRRAILCATLSGRQQSGTPDIWHTEMTFFYGHKHRKGSRNESGDDLAGLVDVGSWGVRIRFQHDERNTGPYAPRLSFDAENARAYKLVAKIGKAVEKIKRDHGWHGITHERLIDTLSVTVVEHVNAHYRTYRIVMAPGDSPLVALARQL